MSSSSFHFGTDDKPAPVPNLDIPRPPRVRRPPPPPPPPPQTPVPRRSDNGDGGVTPAGPTTERPSRVKRPNSATAAGVTTTSPAYTYCSHCGVLVPQKFTTAAVGWPRFGPQRDNTAFPFRFRSFPDSTADKRQ